MERKAYKSSVEHVSKAVSRASVTPNGGEVLANFEPAACSRVADIGDRGARSVSGRTHCGALLEAVSGSIAVWFWWWCCMRSQGASLVLRSLRELETV